MEKKKKIEKGGTVYYILYESSTSSRAGMVLPTYLIYTFIYTSTFYNNYIIIIHTQKAINRDQ